jgi:hypothetical protein
MIPKTPLPHLLEYVDALNETLRVQGHKPLSRIQGSFLCFVLMGMLLTQSLCWARLERASGGRYQDGALCKMFYHGLKCWDYLLAASALIVMKRFNLTSGVLVVDDSDRDRSKNTKRIWGTHKTVLKGTGGFHYAQNIVLLVLVTAEITIPVGASFYRPDPVIREWTKNEKKLIKQGVKKKNRPSKPQRQSDYPSRVELGCALIEQFKIDFPFLIIKAIVADSAYFNPSFAQGINEIYENVQFLSQMRENQKVRFGRDKELSVKDLFAKRKWNSTTIQLRGHRETLVHYSSVVVTIISHGRKYRVVALRYGEEKEPRFLVASDSTWRSEDIIRYYALRWLVEVFIEDWKQHEGWGKMACQQAEDGARRGLLLSLLLDHSLFFYGEQTALVKHKLPALTVGSLRSAIQNDSLVSVVSDVVNDDEPFTALDQLKTQLKEFQIQNTSTKHLSGRTMPTFTPKKRDILHADKMAA